jgi:hypothetical protein
MVLFWFKIKMSMGKSKKDNGKIGNGKVGIGILESVIMNVSDVVC